MRRAGADVYRGYPWKAAFVYVLARSLRAEWVYNHNSEITSRAPVGSPDRPGGCSTEGSATLGR